MALSQQAKQEKSLKKQHKRKLKLKNKTTKNSYINVKIPLKTGHIHECFVSEPSSMVPYYSIFISRINEIDNIIVVAHFLIDTYFGVEDVFLTKEDHISYKNIKSGLSQTGITLKPTPPSIGKKFILNAVEHAKSLGNLPHSDYHIIKDLLFDVDENEYNNVSFEFS